MLRFQLPLLVLILVIAFPTAADHHRTLDVKIESISLDFGNIDFPATTEDLEKLGLKQGDSFKVGFGDNEFEVFWGSDYSDVPQGDWVGFLMNDGMYRIARNYENAAVALGVNVGDTITLYN